MILILFDDFNFVLTSLAHFTFSYFPPASFSTTAQTCLECPRGRKAVLRDSIVRTLVPLSPAKAIPVGGRGQRCINYLHYVQSR